MDKLTLKNYFFYSGGLSLTLQSFLNSLMLHGKECRERARFVKMIEGRVLEVETERVKIGEINCKKNKKGELVYADKDGKETTDKNQSRSFIIDNQEAFQKELQEYLAEEFIIDITPANKQTILTVKDLILNSNKDMNGQESIAYIEWCESFEQVKK
jgi:hypothetical protein